MTIPLALQMQGLLLTFIVSLIMLGIYVLVHLFSYILGDNSLKAKATKEYGQIILNIVFFILLVFMAVPLIDGVIASGIDVFNPYASLEKTPNRDLIDNYNVSYRDAGVALANGTCLYTKEGFVDYKYPAHICTAISFLDRTEWLISETMTGHLYLYNMMGYQASYKIMGGGLFILPKAPYIVTPSFFTFQPFGGLQSEMKIIENSYNMVSKSLISILIQKFTIDMIAQVLFPILLIGGIVFRSFIFTRKFGGFLIAISLSLYYIGPLFYIVGHRALFESGNFVGMEGEKIVGSSIKPVPYADMMLGEGVQWEVVDQTTLDNLNWNNPFDSLNELRKSVTNHITTTNKLSRTFIISHITGRSAVVNDHGLLHMTAKILMFSVMIPLFVLFAILASIKAMAPFFGGDASIAGLTHFL